MWFLLFLVPWQTTKTRRNNREFLKTAGNKLEWIFRPFAQGPSSAIQKYIRRNNILQDKIIYFCIAEDGPWTWGRNIHSNLFPTVLRNSLLFLLFVMEKQRGLRRYLPCSISFCLVVQNHLSSFVDTENDTTAPGRKWRNLCSWNVYRYAKLRIGNSNVNLITPYCSSFTDSKIIRSLFHCNFWNI